MAIIERTIKNKRTASGELAGKPGTVYDVRIKYRSEGKYKNYVKKGFASRREAKQHEAEMQQKLTNTAYMPLSASQQKRTVKEYMEEWIKRREADLRPNTIAGYRNNIENHIAPCIGDVPISQVNGAILDDMYRTLFQKGLSAASVKYVHRVMSVALEHARKYRYIERNPAHDILTRFGSENETPAPYSPEQLGKLLSKVAGTVWEMLILLGGLYGLRLSECIGLRWRNVDLGKRQFAVVEQLPQNLPAGVKQVETFAPVKAGERILPITECTLAYFERQFQAQRQSKHGGG